MGVRFVYTRGLSPRYEVIVAIFAPAARHTVDQADGPGNGLGYLGDSRADPIVAAEFVQWATRQ